MLPGAINKKPLNLVEFKGCTRLLHPSLARRKANRSTWAGFLTFGSSSTCAFPAETSGVVAGFVPEHSGGTVTA